MKTSLDTINILELEKLIDTQMKFNNQNLSGTLHQAAQNALLREQFIMQCTGLMTMSDIADLSKAQSHNQQAPKLNKNTLMFSVVLHGKAFFPSFQFDIKKGFVFPEVSTLIEVLKPNYDLNWQFAIWWITPNLWLNQAPPLLIWQAGQRNDVILAAQHEMHTMGW